MTRIRRTAGISVSVPLDLLQKALEVAGEGSSYSEIVTAALRSYLREFGSEPAIAEDDGKEDGS
jgi:metal-responsive CopG/Arc/MetJ family transcriptional regulator